MATGLTLTPQPANQPPRVRIDVDASSVAGAVSVLITRTDPDGGVRPVRLAEPAALVAGLWTGYDYELPYGVSVVYTATVLNGSGSTVDQPAAASGLTTVTTPWLVHPGVPALSMPLGGNMLISFGTRTRAVNRGLFQPFGRDTPIVVTDGKRKTPSGTLRLRTRTLGELGAFLAINDSAAVLLVNVPGSLGWGVTAEYVSFGDLDEDRALEVGVDAERIWSVPYQVVSRPVGGSQSQRTYATVLAESASYQQLLATRATYLELLAPTS